MKRSATLSKFALAALLLAAVRNRQAPATGSEKSNPITLSVEGVERSYLLFVPAAKVSKPRPLVLQLHGGRGSGSGMDRLTRFNELGKNKGFLVASPDGVGGNWNDGRANDAEATTRNMNDVAFLDAIIADAATRSPIDRSRVYVVGISNGAFMANRYACERSDRVAGIGLVAGTMAPVMRDACKPTRPVRVIDFHGTDDPLVFYGGGVVAGDKGESVAVDDMLKVWTTTNSCSEKVTTQTIKDVAIRTWNRCRRGVKAFRVDKGGHTWPGGSQYLPVRIIGCTTNTVNATEEMWKFFSAK